MRVYVSSVCVCVCVCVFSLSVCLPVYVTALPCGHIYTRLCTCGHVCRATDKTFSLVQDSGSCQCCQPSVVEAEVTFRCGGQQVETTLRVPQIASCDCMACGAGQCGCWGQLVRVILLSSLLLLLK